MTFFGLVFSAEVGGIRIKTTRRVDLAATRVRQDARRLSDLENAKRLARRQGRQLERSFSPRTIGAIKTPSIEAARKLRRVLLRAIALPGSGDRLTEAQAYDALNRCRRLGLEVETVRLVSGEPPSPRDRHRPEHRHIGGTVAEVSMIDIIGGFARIKRRTEAQTLAASSFRALAEQSQIGAKAIDYQAAKVDTSGPTQAASEIVAINATDARRRYLEARDCLDPQAVPVMERMILLDQSVTDIAQGLGYGKGGTARDKVTGIALAAANDLAEHFGYMGRAAVRRPHVRADGDPPTTFTGHVSTRRRLSG